MNDLTKMERILDLAKRQKDLLIIGLKGLVIGASMLIPGVSGGTMAIILGIYDRLIHAISTLRKNLKKSILLLLPFCLGAVLGIVLLSKLMLNLVNNFEMPMMYLFLGAIIASVYPLYKKAKARKFNWISVLFAGCGLLIVLLIEQLPENLFSFSSGFGPMNMITLLLAGVIIAIALVLPGISASYMLLMLGLYDITLKAISEVQILFLLPLVLGVLGGTLLTTGILEKAMDKYPHPTYLLIIGFVLGSVVDVFPGLPSGLTIIPCVLCLGVGFTIILLLARYSD